MNEHSGSVVLADWRAGLGTVCTGLRAIDCAQCGFVHLNPLPTQEVLDKLYQDEYYQYHHADLFCKEKREQWYWRLVYRERLREFAQVIDRHAIVLLDYGAGFGWFVCCIDRYEDRDFIAWGYEPGAIGINRSSTSYVFCDLPIELRFDAIHLSFVLEHVRDPLLTLREIHGLLMPGGILCIIVPNEFNKLQTRLRRRGNYTPLHPHHVNYFTPVSLQRLVEKAGFEVMRTTATFPIEALALWGGLDYTRWPRLGAVAHWARMIFEAGLLIIAPKLKRRLFEWFARKGVGREVELWLRKK